MPLKNFLTPLKIGCAASGIVVGARLLGLLQFWEWAAYDRFLSWKPTEAPDERIVLVSIEESDIQRAKTYPFSDRLWAEFLNKLKTYQPRVIGLDIFRDQPVAPGEEELREVFRTFPNLIGITKLLAGRVPASPILAQKAQIGDVSTPLDRDGVVRRTYLYPVSDLKNPDSAIPNLGLKLAEEYLKTEGIESKNSDINSDWLQLGQGHYPHFRPNDGGYINDATGGYSILINWHKPPQSVASVKFFDVIDGDVPQDFFKDRLVILGVGGESFNDFHESPFTGLTNREVRGIDLHAQVASQLISTAMGERSLIQFWPEWGEILWIWAWGTAAAIVLWRFGSNRLLLSTLVIGGGMTLLCFGISYIAIRQAWWLPSVPPVIAIWMASIPAAYGWANRRLEGKNRQLLEAQAQLTEFNQDLEQIVRQRTEDLQSAYQQIIKSEKLLTIQQLLEVLGNELNYPALNLDATLNSLHSLIADFESNPQLEQSSPQKLEAF